MVHQHREVMAFLVSMRYEDKNLETHYFALLEVIRLLVQPGKS